MKDKEKQQSYFVNIGASSLLVIFLILCLITFAILSLSSAKSDYSFSQRLAQHRQAYYNACAKAEEIVEEIDSILSETANNIDLFGSSASDGFDSYLSSVAASLDGMQINDTSVSCDPSGDKFLISFQVPAGESQSLHVALQVTDCREQAAYYDLMSWQVVNTSTQESDQPLNLISIQE